MKKTAARILLLIAIATPAWPQLPAIKPGFNLFSKQQDVQLGREAAAQVRQQMSLVHNRELESYVRGIGQRLAAQPQAGDYPYTFEVVNDKSVNAFALPGGPTFVNTGLLLEAQNEAQIAGVLAHEISHVALRHGTNQASKANLIQLPAMIAGGVLGGGSMLGQLAQVGIGLGANSVLLKFSRTAESQADQMGAEIMAGAGYNPIELARFFERLQAQTGKGSAFTQFLSDHPNPGNRVQAVERIIRFLPQKEYVTRTGDLPKIQAIVRGLPATPAKGASQRGAAVEAPTLPPAGDFREHRGQKFAISYPSNWHPYGDSQSNMVTLAPEEGLVQGAVGYGAIVSYYLPESNSIDLSRDTRALINQLQSKNRGMRVANSSRSITAGGASALLTELTSQSPYANESEVDLLITVARPEGLFYAVLITPRSQYKNVRPVFQRMLESIRFS